MWQECSTLPGYEEAAGTASPVAQADDALKNRRLASRYRTTGKWRYVEMITTMISPVRGSKALMVRYRPANLYKKKLEFAHATEHRIVSVKRLVNIDHDPQNL